MEYRTADGAIRGAQNRVIDFDDPAGNDWLAVNQFTVAEGRHNRRPDIVLFLNGFPVGVTESRLKLVKKRTHTCGINKVPAEPVWEHGFCPVAPWAAEPGNHHFKVTEPDYRKTVVAAFG